MLRLVSVVFRLGVKRPGELGTFPLHWLGWRHTATARMLLCRGSRFCTLPHCCSGARYCSTCPPCCWRGRGCVQKHPSKFPCRNCCTFSLPMSRLPSPYWLLPAVPCCSSSSSG